MVTFSREFKTGLVVIVIAAVFVWGYNYLKGHNLFEGASHSYFTEYNNVQGLNTASMVTINGYEVGKVVDISFNDDLNKRGQLVVEFTVENDFQFSKNSVAKIYSASLMGGKSLAVIPSYDGAIAVPGDYLTGEIESDMFSSVGEKLNPLQAKLESVIVSADSLLVHLNDVMDKRTIKNLKASIQSFKGTM
jgi:phospholipid/cholesterol/gamma-HCH transport system substrate-binding protein